MLQAILQFSLKHRFAVIATSLLILAMAFYQLQSASYDVFPEFAPPQVIVQTEAPGFSSEQVETLVTQVVEQALGGANGITSMRSTSIQGLSAVEILFDLKSNILTDRQVISERLADLSGALPAGIKPPQIGPLVSTTHIVAGIGLTSDKLNLTDLRTIADWQIRPQLLGVTGVADTESYGGFFRQIQIQVKPKLLKKYGLNFNDVMATARQATGIRGAGVIDAGGQRITMNIATDASTMENIAKTPLTRGTGETLDLSITLGDVATIAEDHTTPFGAASIMGKPGVLLLVISQYGANTLDVTRRLEQLTSQMQPALEKQGIHLRSDLIRPASFIETSLKNMQHSLLIGAALVTITLLIFLWNARAALISALAIPFSLVLAAATLNMLGISLNIMSIGGLAIAVGLVVDDAVIDVENMLRHLRGSEANKDKFLKYKILLASSLEVRIPVIVATIAVLLISIPIMTMSGIGGRLFAPLGIAYAIATLFSLIVALTLTPALCMAFLKEDKDEVPALTKWLQKKYIVILEKTANLSTVLIGITILSAVGLVIGFYTLKTEFLPELHEGHFILHMEAEPGASLETSADLGKQVTNKLLNLPFIDAIVQQTGRTESGIDFWGTQTSEFNIAIKPSAKIDEDVAKEKILAELEPIKGAEFELETFLTERMQEVISGHTSEAALNVYGEDLDALEKVSEDLANFLKTVPGVRDVQRPSKTGTPELDITLNQQALTQWGLDPITVLDMIHTAYQGEVISQIYDLHHPTDVAVILDAAKRNDITGLGELPIATPSGDYITLKEVAKIEQKSGRFMLEHDSGRRVQSVTFNMEKHSKHVLLKHLRTEISKKNLPAGIYTSLVSLSEEQVKASKQLLIHSIIASIAIVILLSLVMKHQSQIWLVLANTPLALVGGIVGLFLTGNSLSLGAVVGFVTLIGITLRNSVLMLSHYAYVMQHEQREWNKQTAFVASAERLLPIMMTAIVTGIGLLPIALSSGQSGHEIEGPMAIVIIGGLISSTVLNLLFLPILSLKYGTFEKVD